MNTYINGSDEIKRSQNFNGQNHVAAPGMCDEVLIASVKGLVGRDAKLADYKKPMKHRSRNKNALKRKKQLKRKLSMNVIVIF